MDSTKGNIFDFFIILGAALLTLIFPKRKIIFKLPLSDL